jgi:hypothetical protein
MTQFARKQCALLIGIGCLFACVASTAAQIVPVLPATAPATHPTATARPAPPAGDFAGVLKVGAFTLRLGLKVEKAGDGFTGVLDSIDQGAKLPIDRIEFAGGKLKLTIAKIGGGYEGTFTPDGESIDGNGRRAGRRCRSRSSASRKRSRSSAHRSRSRRCRTKRRR